MDTRSGVARNSVVPPTQPKRGPALERVSSATLHKDRASPTKKQHQGPDGNPVTSALGHGRAIWSQSLKWSQRLVLAPECNCVTPRAANSSGFPTITTPSFSKCPASSPILVGAHDRRPRQVPLAREDIPHVSHVASSPPPPGPDVIPNFNL